MAREMMLSLFVQAQILLFLLCDFSFRTAGVQGMGTAHCLDHVLNLHPHPQ